MGHLRKRGLVPVLTVYGIPAELQNSLALRALLLEKLPEAASSVPEMEISPDLVTAFAPGDLLDKGLGNEVIVTILGLFSRTKRTAEVLEWFAQAIRDCVVEFAQANVDNCCMVEVFDVKNPDACFADWRRPD